MAHTDINMQDLYNFINSDHTDFNMQDLYDALVDMEDPFDVLTGLRKIKKLIKAAFNRIILVCNEIEATRTRQTRSRSSNHHIFKFNHQMKLNTLIRFRALLYKYHEEHINEAMELDHKLKQLLGANFHVGFHIACKSNSALCTSITLEDTQFE